MSAIWWTQAMNRGSVTTCRGPPFVDHQWLGAKSLWRHEKTVPSFARLLGDQWYRRHSAHQMQIRPSSECGKHHSVNLAFCFTSWMCLLWCTVWSMRTGNAWDVEVSARSAPSSVLNQRKEQAQLRDEKEEPRLERSRNDDRGRFLIQEIHRGRHVGRERHCDSRPRSEKKRRRRRSPSSDLEDRTSRHRKSGAQTRQWGQKKSIDTILGCVFSALSGERGHAQRPQL